VLTLNPALEFKKTRHLSESAKTVSESALIYNHLYKIRNFRDRLVCVDLLCPISREISIHDIILSEFGFEVDAFLAGFLPTVWAPRSQCSEHTSPKYSKQRTHQHLLSRSEFFKRSLLRSYDPKIRQVYLDFGTTELSTLQERLALQNIVAQRIEMGKNYLRQKGIDLVTHAFTASEDAAYSVSAFRNRSQLDCVWIPESGEHLLDSVGCFSLLPHDPPPNIFYRIIDSKLEVPTYNAKSIELVETAEFSLKSHMDALGPHPNSCDNSANHIRIDDSAAAIIFNEDPQIRIDYSASFEILYNAKFIHFRKFGADERVCFWVALALGCIPIIDSSALDLTCRFNRIHRIFTSDDSYQTVSKTSMGSYGNELLNLAIEFRDRVSGSGSISEKEYRPQLDWAPEFIKEWLPMFQCR